MVEMYMAYSYSKQKMVRPGAVQENHDAITGGNIARPGCEVYV